VILPRANPAKAEDFGDKDLLQGIDLARLLFGEAIPLARDSRWAFLRGRLAPHSGSARNQGLYPKLK
jgi:hypothetical protein